MAKDLSLIERIESSNYSATEQQVEHLAAAHQGSAIEVAKVDGTYLRVFISGVQALIGTTKPGPGRRKKLSKDSQEEAVEKIHTLYYAAVLRGVTTPDIAADPALGPAESTRRSLERNKRSNFARSVKSTVLAFVWAGEDLRGVDVHTVSKRSLRAAISPPESGNKFIRRVDRARVGLVRGLERLAAKDVEMTRGILEHVLAELQALWLRVSTPTIPTVQPAAPAKPAQPVMPAVPVVEDHSASTTIVGRRLRKYQEARVLHKSATS